MAANGERLFMQYGTGLGFLATVAPSGIPRLHPVSPVLTDDSIFLFLVPSPKRLDLEGGGRYALHAFTPEETEEEFVISGRTRPVDDPERRAVAVDAASYRPPLEWRCFEALVESALHAAYRHRGDWPPTYTRWPTQLSSDHKPNRSPAPRSDRLSGAAASTGPC
jgi:hypothetical protein